ncbi:hypothetical protein NDI39_15325 [Microcoleus sp. ZQ-A2]
MRKKALFFNNLQQHQFSGQLVLADGSGKQGSFYLYLGDIQYATGGIHPVRRWQRNLAENCPQLSVQKSELSGIDAESLTLCWEYQLLCLWVAHQKITYTQAAKIIRSVILEVLLEIGQLPDLTYQINSERLLSTQFELVPINSEYIITEFQGFWNLWKIAKWLVVIPIKHPSLSNPSPSRNKHQLRFIKLYLTCSKCSIYFYTVPKLRKLPWGRRSRLCGGCRCHTGN